MSNLKITKTRPWAIASVIASLFVLGSFLSVRVAHSEDRLAELERLSQQAKKAREKMMVEVQKQAKEAAQEKVKSENKKKEQDKKERKAALKKMEKDAKKRSKRREKEDKEERKRWEKDLKENEKRSASTDYQKRKRSEQEWVRVNGQYVPASNSRRDKFGPWMEMGGLSSSGSSSGRTGGWRGSEGGSRNLSMGVRATIIRLNGPNGDE